MLKIDYVAAGETVSRFHESDAFVRGLMGPVGSSKSSACCIELFMRACCQRAFEGKRLTRFGVTRASYRELKSTTIKTWMEWFPFAKITWESPIVSTVDLPLPDGTRVQMETLFFPIESPTEIEKLSSLEITGFWMNEARENPVALMQKLTERTGRYPARRFGGPSWSGGVMDTNAPDDDHWWYKLAEGSDIRLIEHMMMVESKMRELGYLGTKQRLYEFLRQPGALIMKDSGELDPNPLAENIQNLNGGYAYYYKQAAGKSREWIKAQILGQYASVATGKPVYPEYNDELHCRRARPNSAWPLILGFDYGLTPACAITQVTPRGQLIVVDELFAKDMGIRQFARDVVKPHLEMNYREFHYHAVGDPAGASRRDTDEKTCFMELAEEGIACVPAISNSLIARREAVAKYLTRMTDGQPAFLIDPKCEMLRRGFNGRYQYERVNVIGDERFRDVPLKNDFSHLHDALQYGALYSQSANLKDSPKKLVYPPLGIV